MLTYVELVFYGACSFACRKKRPLILVIRGQGWLFWLCYSMFLSFILGVYLFNSPQDFNLPSRIKKFTKLYN